MALNCYIIDDEQPAINVLASFVEKVSFLNLVGTNTNALKAFSTVSSDTVDLLFLDVEMPDITGIQFLQSLEKRPIVIFTTAYDQYALQGYELDVVDYLVKPIPFERFLKGVGKALKIHESSISQSTQESFLFVKSDYKTLKIALDDILYIEGLKDYVKIYTISGMILTRLNLKGIEKRLPTDKFIRIHRSYIVSYSKITAFQKHQILIDEKNLPIGETYRQNLLNKLA